MFTLNCWGLKVVSKLRKERFSAIANYLCEHPGSGYDVVFLQVSVYRDPIDEWFVSKICDLRTPMAFRI